MSYQSIVDEYVTSRNVVDMFMLTKMTAEFICEVELIKPELVDKFKTDLKMYMHPFKDKESAECAVSHLENEDGTKGGHWSFEETSKIAEKEGVDKFVFHYVLNMIYSDFYDSRMSENDYVKYALKFMKDKDAPKDKASLYYRAMHYYE